MKNLSQHINEALNVYETRTFNKENGIAANKTMQAIDNDDDLESFIYGLIDSDIHALAFIKFGRQKASSKSTESLRRLILNSELNK